MEIRLARANSLIDVKNNDNIDVVTGFPATIMERVSLIEFQSTKSLPLISTQDSASHCAVEEPEASGAPHIH